MRRPPTYVLEIARVLRRLLKGERLTVSQMAEYSTVKRTAIRTRWQGLAAELEDHLVASVPTKGKAQEFRWEWPAHSTSTREQVWGLAAARELLHGLYDSEIGRILEELLASHRARLPHEGSGARDLSRMFYANRRVTAAPADRTETVDTVAQAIHQLQNLAFDYTEFHGATHTVCISPWTLVMDDEGLYVYGLCTDCKTDSDKIDTERLYSLARIKEARTTGETFTYPVISAFDPAKLFGSVWGVTLPHSEHSTPRRIVLRFGTHWQAFLECQPLHAKQERVEMKDDAVFVHLTLHLTYDLVRWIRGHGDEVTVVEPRELAEWVNSNEGFSGHKKWVSCP